MLGTVCYNGRFCSNGVQVVLALGEYGLVLFLLRRATLLEHKCGLRPGTRRRRSKKAHLLSPGEEDSLTEARRLRMTVATVDSYALAFFPILAGVTWTVFWTYYLCL